MDNLLKHDSTFRYRLLSRLKQDCDYYLSNGNRYSGHLWADNEKEQIESMIKLHNSFKENDKPEWLTMDEILEYKDKMIKSVKAYIVSLPLHTTELEARDYLRGFVWGDCEIEETSLSSHTTHIESFEGVEMYFDSYLGSYIFIDNPQST